MKAVGIIAAAVSVFLL
jgi:hypothetical protein